MQPPWLPWQGNLLTGNGTRSRHSRAFRAACSFVMRATGRLQLPVPSARGSTASGAVRVVVVLAVALFVAAGLSSLFGQGGGSLYTPVQLWLGVPAHQAAAQSLLLIVVTSVSSTLVFRSHYETDWVLCALLEAPTAVGAAFAGLVSSLLPQTAMGVLLCTLLIIAAVAVQLPYRAASQPGPDPAADPNRPGVITRHTPAGSYTLNLWVVFPVMGLIGLLTSTVGLGGGILKLPAMVLVFRIPWRIAVGSSAFMVGVTALVGLVSHAGVGHLVVSPWLLLYAAAVFVGAQVGSRVSYVLPQASLRVAYGWFLIGAALITFVRLFLLPTEPAL